MTRRVQGNGERPIGEFTVGDRVEITRITATGALKQRFYAFGLERGASVTVEAFAPGKGTMKLRLNTGVIAIRAEEAGKVFGRKV